MSNNVQISAQELANLRAIARQVEEKKAKAVISSQRSRANRIANMDEDELEEFKARNRAASRRSNAKKRNMIAAMAARIAELEAQQA